MTREQYERLAADARRAGFPALADYWTRRPAEDFDGDAAVAAYEQAKEGVIVATLEVLHAPPPQLTDYHMVDEVLEPTQVLPSRDEGVWEVVMEDRGGSRAALRREAVSR